MPQYIYTYANPLYCRNKVKRSCLFKVGQGELNQNDADSALEFYIVFYIALKFVRLYCC